ncbi:methylenetetrahydrofolate reductase [NAD(P)H] [Pseudohalioglobus sediminis]|uniref:Methylenetetrahydrofolate reductase n=1 Tax=Pseudohalioglobus sediminis TaxID=2606449 RepID=A0A5B0WVJ1_9GAMM|nr:methylenetetrahydrofolate reductase [NAD(P)H] [Pseudohalioglobus sediminis]KAA1190418.1 methylenetetrahydrofolate reductase [NAD(P)H] [Pseudohalioglobus sediminis]
MAKPRISFEFFPPKTPAGKDKLLNETTPALNALGPEFFSVTYGAGGATRDTTLGVVSAIRETGIDVAPHLSFGGDDEETVAQLLETYKARGITRLVALRGDMPSGMGAAMQLVYANELVDFIRQRTGDHFQIHVAAYPEIHPESRSYQSDVEFLKRKLDAGANSAITQYFYNVEAYFYFLDQCAAMGIDKPVYAGIMPITNFQNLARFSRNCGAEIPRWICKRMEDFGDDQESVRQFGLEVVTQLCQTLIESGCPGIHFYTMNQVEPTRQIYNNLGL